MMPDLERMIDQALHEEEGDLLRRMGEEPAFMDQAFGIFGGRTGWVNAYLIVAQTLIFFAGVWTAWMFFAAGDAVTQLRWGLPAAVLLLMAVMLKMAVWPTIQTNRVLRELKLIQLQLARKTGQAETRETTVD
jgi:hypothetical protein